MVTTQLICHFGFTKNFMHKSGFLMMFVKLTKILVYIFVILSVRFALIFSA